MARAENEKAAAAAAEAQLREVLLSEMQHRVKNNLQIILSMVGLQKRRVPDREAQRALDHVANRITAISLAHDQLDPRQGSRVVSLASYLRALCAAIEQQHEGFVVIDFVSDDVPLLIDRAVPLGLVLNEAVVNSVKHAFDEDGGRIKVQLTAGIGRGEARLSVSDNGKGVDPSRPQGSGTRLIQSLAAQIGGSTEQESSEGGTSTRITFPVIT
jgi:two-component sensor histidine kinase